MHPSIGDKLEKDLLWFACRHDILEIVLEVVVVHALGRPIPRGRPIDISLDL